jgi:hypothetical protein
VQYVREAVFDTLRDSMREAVRDMPVMSGQPVPVCIFMDQRLVYAELMRSVQYLPEAMREAVPDAVLILQQIR